MAGFEILSKAQQSANEKIQGLSNELPTRDQFPLAAPLADLKGTLPNPENIKEDFKTPDPVEESKADDIKTETQDERTGEKRTMTSSELWMQDNFPVEHKNEGYTFHFKLSNDFPDDVKFKIAVGNPDGKFSTKIKKRKKRSQRKKYGDYEWIFNKPSKKFLVTYHMDKDWPSYMNKIERRCKLIPTYSGPPLSDYIPSPDAPEPETKEEISGGIEYYYTAEILGTSTIKVTISNNAGLPEFSQLYVGHFNGAKTLEEGKVNAIESRSKKMDMFGEFWSEKDDDDKILWQQEYPKTGDPIPGAAQPETTPPPPPENSGTSSGDSIETETPTETGTNTEDKQCPEGQIWDEEIQACVLPTVEVEGQIPPEVVEKEKKFNEVKDQINTTEKKVTNMNGELLKTSTECTSVLALGTSMISISGVLEKISGVLDKGAKAGEATTKTMKATYPSHPGPGNLNVADTTRSTDDIKNESVGFAANLKQQLSNLGDFLMAIIEKIMAFLKLIMPILMALLAILALIAFLKQLLEMSFLGFLKKSSSSNQGDNKADKAGNPDEFLAEIGYPGYGDGNTKPKDEVGRPLTPTEQTQNQQYQDQQESATHTAELIKESEVQLSDSTSKTDSLLDKIRKETTPPTTINSSDLDRPLTPGESSGTCSIPGHSTEESCIAAGGVWTSSDDEPNILSGGGIKTPHIDNLGLSDDTEKDITSPTQPLIIGGTQIGKPVTDKTLNLKNHSILGDISNIHPQIVNLLYETGTIPKEILPEFKTPEGVAGVPNTATYQEQLDGYYDKVLDDLKTTKQTEYIQKIFNAKFEYIGYKRYRA